MKNFEKESIFWFGLQKVAKDNMQLKYLIMTEKEFIISLAPVCFYGIHQYILYRGICITEISSDELTIFADYILENYNELYKVRYRLIKDKPKKVNFKNEQEVLKSREVLENLLLPYFNEYCFKTLNGWKVINRAYISEMITNFEFDINHESEDGKTKTSELYPFLFTLNLINNAERKGLYQRVQKYFDRSKLLKAYKSGREWKEKEEQYLHNTFELIDNAEEWSLFLSNFCLEKWDEYDLEERFKSLFQLTKLSCILMKDEITSVTMMGNGEEQFEILQNYLPLFINEDKIVSEHHTISNEAIQKYEKTLSPFPAIHINPKSLFEYIITKENRHIEVSEEKLISTCQIVLSILTKLKIMLLTHEYLPDVIDSQISVRKKVWVDILNIFSNTDKVDKFKRNLAYHQVSLEDFFISEEEFHEMESLSGVKKPIYHAYNGFKKIGKIMSYMLGINNPTAKVFDYDVHEIVKYILIVFGPHPQDHTVQKPEMVKIISTLFIEFCRWFESQDEQAKYNLISFLDLPLRLLNLTN